MFFFFNFFGLGFFVINNICYTINSLKLYDKNRIKLITNNIGIPINKSCYFLYSNFNNIDGMLEKPIIISNNYDYIYCINNSREIFLEDSRNISYSVYGVNNIGKSFVVSLNYLYEDVYNLYYDGKEIRYLNFFKKAIKDLILKVFNNSYIADEILLNIKSNKQTFKYIGDYVVALSETYYWPDNKGYTQEFRIIEKNFCKFYDYNFCDKTPLKYEPFPF